MSSEKEVKVIQLSVLKAQVESGMKKKALAEFYGLPMTQMTKALQSAGLKIRKFHNSVFIIKDDTLSDATEKAAEVSEESAPISEVPFETPEEKEEEAPSAPETLGDVFGSL